MCRMLIAVGNINISSLLDELISMANEEYERHEMNQDQNWKHDGGWGIAYLKNNRWKIRKSKKAVFNDPKVGKLREIKTNLAILHARKVTIGKISRRNTHPFQKKDFVFCHNGTVRDKISHSSKFKVKGDTDSEHLFYSILTENEKEKDLVKAIRKNLNRYKNYAGSNFILANKEKSFVFIKKNKLPLYYQMKMGKEKDFVIISSEKLPLLTKMKWQKLEQEDLIIIDNKTLKVEINKK
jgi:predicted glutamine amidotransferase